MYWQAFDARKPLSRRVVLKGMAGLSLLLGAESCTGAPSSSSASVIAKPTRRAQGSVLSTYHGHTKRVTAVGWSADGKRIASGSLDTTVQVWEATEKDPKTAYIYRGHSDEVHTLAWSPDSQRIASGSADRTVQVWEAMPGGKTFTYHGHSDTITAVAWSPDGQYIASGSMDGTVQVWEALTGTLKQRYRGHTEGVTTLGWAPDGQRIASGSVDKTVQIWEALSGQLVYTYRGHSEQVSSVSWSPREGRIASGSWDKTVQVWEASNGKVSYTYRGYRADEAKYNTSKGVLPDLIFFVAWSHSGKRIAAVTQVYCGDICAVVVVWDADTEGNITFYQDLPVFALAWSPDDTRLATGIGLSQAQISQVS